LFNSRVKKLSELPKKEVGKEGCAKREVQREGGVKMASWVSRLIFLSLAYSLN
jgi:hypothetical protein